MIYNYILCWIYSMTKCCNCFNFYPCILWDFIVLSLVLSWWRIKHETKISTVLRLARKKFVSKGSREKGTWEAHARSWRVMPDCQFYDCLARVMPSYQFRDCLMSRANPRGTHETLCLEDFRCDLLTFHPYYIYPHYPQKYERLFKEKNPR